MTALATAPFAAPRGFAPPAPPPARAERDEFEAWREKVEDARELRRRIDTKVWTPLYQGLASRRMLGRAVDDLTNPFQQMLDVVLPHLLGDDREFLVKVNKVALAAGEDPRAKQAYGDGLAGLATGLTHACGIYGDAMGRQGEFEKCVRNSAWSLGVMLVGFEPPRGRTPARGERDDRPPQAVDLNLAYADHNELADAGSPYGRCISARRFLGDATFNDFSKGAWAGVEYFLSVAEARARFPRWRDNWKKTHNSAPTGAREADAKAGGDGVIGFVDIYTRDPSEILTIPLSRSSGVEAIVERREVELGVEGLPFRLLGHDWIDDIAYPKPLLLRILGSGTAENDFLAAVMGSGRKLKSLVLVNKTQNEHLAKAIRKGEPDGVYEVEGDPATALHQQDVGALRREYLDLAEQAHANTERDGGISDFVLGVREPGNPTVPETQARQGAVQARRANALRPTRQFEASVAQALVAIALAKKELLHGLALQLPRDGGLAVIDATRPVIGELLDYTFTAQVTDAVTQADDAQLLGGLIQQAPGFDQLLAPLGKRFQSDLLLTEFLRKSRTPQAERYIVELPPQPQPAAAADSGFGGQGAEQPGAAAPPPDDPAMQYEQLVQMLQQLPEGDQREEQVMQALAQLVAQHPELQGPQ